MFRVTAAIAALAFLSGCGTTHPAAGDAPSLPRTPFDTTPDPPREEEFFAPNLIIRTVATRIRVVVARAEDGQPLAGATVEVIHRGHPARKGTTGEDGGVVFDGLPRMDVSIFVRAPGRAEERFVTRNGGVIGEEVNPEDPDSPVFAEIQFPLARASSVDGVVLSAADRRPVPGARLTTIRGGSMPDAHEYPYDSDPRLDAVTDGEGRFTASPVPEGAIVSFVARHPDFVPTSLAIRVGREPPPGGPVEILMEPAATIRGIVLGPDGVPYGGALVRAAPFVWDKGNQEEDTTALRFPPDIGPFDPPEGDHGGAAVTGKDGAFEIRCLEPVHRHRVFAFVGETLRSPLEEVRTTAAGESVLCELRLRPLARVSVRVEDPAGGPVFGASVTLAPPEGPWPEEERWGPQEDGIYRFEGVMPGTWRLRVASPGLEPSETSLVVPEEREFAATVRLGAGLTLEGIIVDDTGRPLADVHVAAVPVSGEERNRIPSRRTDPNGRFRFEGLSAGRYSVGTASDSAARYVFAFSVEVEPPFPDVRVVAPRHAGVVLSLSVPPGRDLPASVYIFGSTKDAEGRQVNMGGGAILDGATARCTRLYPGRTELTISAEGFAPAHRTFESVPGQVVDLGEVALETGLRLKGRVVDSLGRPVSGARVDSTTTDSEGVFTVDNLPEGERTLWAWSKDFLQGSATVMVRPGMEEVVLTLERGALVTGIVRGTDGIPRRATVRFTRPGGGEDDEDWTSADDDGRFEICLPPGTWTAIAQWKDRDSEPVVLALSEGTETAIKLTVPVK